MADPVAEPAAAAAAALRPLTFELLSRLSHERFTSGEALARTLGVSRHAVMAALHAAAAVGVEVFALPRQGYRLAAPLELLDLKRIHAAMGKAARRIDLDAVPVIDSTNSAIAARLSAGAPSGIALAAEWQHAGRGRRGRAWTAPFASGLTFSVGWRIARTAAELGGLSLAVGVAIARAIDHFKPKRAVQLKWPNDVVCEGRKLGGVLIESQGDMLGPLAVTLGIGLNVCLPEEAAAQLDQPVTDVAFACGGLVSRNALLARLLTELVDVLDAFHAHGFHPLAAEWSRRHALAGAPVRVHPGNGTWYEAEVRGVADDGSLLVRRAGEELALHSGEISVRRRP
ncbi:MAG: biotin--[acetyl-CoA-carboxylase] ligase [Betaproteobacteria bacterium]|nr:biotin--[acetyl-CoA-carboxylase] ligase [Betaproteobacteria bacterium]